jgi:5-amino-6-(5-phosphoribosylamino)uracil reductase
MTADGKISAEDPKAPPNFSAVDFAHLEYQASLADLILVGAQTIRLEETTFTINNPELLAGRKIRGQSPQPITCVVSHSLDLPPTIPFFSQEIERWIFTTQTSLERSSDATILGKQAELFGFGDTELDWDKAYNLIAERGIRKVVALGGGSLAASLVKAGRIDDWWLTIWPAIYGGKQAPTPVEGVGFIPHNAPKLELLETRQVGSELFLHYRIAQALPKLQEKAAMQEAGGRRKE